MGSPSALDLTTSGTVAAWVYSIDSTSFPPIAGKENWTSNRNGYLLALGDGTQNVVASIASASSETEVAGATTMSLNAWHHVAMTWDGTTIWVYLDGSPDGSGSQGGIVPAPSSSTFMVGAATNYLSSLLDGYIDDVRVYSGAMTAAQVNDLYNGTDPSSGVTLVGKWLFDTGTCP
jgi:hypothetical protein